MNMKILKKKKKQNKHLPTKNKTTSSGLVLEKAWKFILEFFQITLNLKLTK